MNLQPDVSAFQSMFVEITMDDVPFNVMYSLKFSQHFHSAPDFIFPLHFIHWNNQIFQS